jgi:hypothetical protein
MARAWMLLLAAVLCGAAAAGCGGSSADWVASEVVVVDERASCVDVTERDGDRRLSVCRDNRGVVSCRLADDASRAANGSDCDAAIEAVRAWESDATRS